MRQDKAPAFQWYPKDILTSQRVALLTLTEEGAYRRALDFCWLNETLPNNAKALAKIIGKGCSLRTAEVIMKLFTAHPTDADKLIHTRLEHEREKQREWREKSVEGGKRSAAARKKVKQQEACENEPPLQNGCNQTSTLQSSSSSPSSSSSSSNINYINKRASDFLIEKSNEEIQYMLAHKYLELDKQVIFARLDEEYPPGYKFNNQNHLFNAFKRVADKLLKEKSCAKKEKKKVRPGEDRDGYGTLTLPPGM